MLNQFKKICAKNYKIFLGIGVAMLVLVILPDITFAQVDPNSQSADVGRELVKGLSTAHTFLQRLLFPLLLMIGSLLQNDLLFGGGMEEKLLDIWVEIRNIVNILFTLLLLGIAFYNVVGAGENYHVKTILKKFVIALIAVNFSFIGIKVVLDGINVLTTGIFALPGTVQEELKAESFDGICGEIYGKPANAQNAVYKDNIEKAVDSGAIVFCNTDGTLNMKDAEVARFFATYNSRNAALAMAFAFQKVNLLNEINIPPGQETIDKLALQFLFSIVLYIVYATAFVALFVVLLVRLVALWLMLALSPLIALKMILPETLTSSLGGGGDIGKKFIQNAIAPIPIAFVMSIGFILLTALEKAKFPNGNLADPTLSINLLTSGITNLQQLIVAIASVAFIWTGVFQAAQDTYAGSITGKIKDFVGGAGKAIAQLPMLVPMFPIATGDTQAGKDQKFASLGDIMYGAELARDYPKSQMRKSGEALFGGGTAKDAEELADSKTIKQIQERGSSLFSARGDKNVQQAFAKALKKVPETEWQTPLDYKGTKDKFLEDLEKGNVIDRSQMEDFYGRNGIDKGSSPEDKNPKTDAAATTGAATNVAAASQKAGTGAAYAKAENKLTAEQLAMLDDSAALSSLLPGSKDKLTKLKTALQGNASTDKEKDEINKAIALAGPGLNELHSARENAKKADVTLTNLGVEVTGAANGDAAKLETTVEDAVKKAYNELGITDPTIEPTDAGGKLKYNKATTQIRERINSTPKLTADHKQKLRTGTGSPITKRVLESTPTAAAPAAKPEAKPTPPTPPAP